MRGRRNRNKISEVQRDNGTWTRNEEELVNEMSMFYNMLFSSGGIGDSSKVLRGINHTITEEMNTNLTRPVHEEEIRSAIFSMNPDKAPGVDGMTPLFFQKFWTVIKKDVVKAVQDFFLSGCMLKSINHTIISLIPKILNPTSLKNYRPISLCSVLCQIISKILANRLKPVLDKCISKNQSAFIPDRQILDNVIIA